MYSTQCYICTQAYRNCRIAWHQHILHFHFNWTCSGKNMSILIIWECHRGQMWFPYLRHLKHLVAYWSSMSSQKPQNLAHWGIHHMSPVIRVGKFAQNHLLVFPMQLVAFTVEIPPMHPVRWLCSTAVPEWAQWYSTSVNSQDFGLSAVCMENGRWSPDPSQVVCRIVTTTMPIPTGREITIVLLPGTYCA